MKAETVESPKEGVIPAAPEEEPSTPLLATEGEGGKCGFVYWNIIDGCWGKPGESGNISPPEINFRWCDTGNFILHTSKRFLSTLN